MSGASIAAEVDAALREVAMEVGSGVFVGVLVRPGYTAPVDDPKPWDAPVTVPDQRFTVAIMDTGTRVRYDRDIGGALIPRTVRTFMVSATGPAPHIGDEMEVRGETLVLSRVTPLAPAGDAIYHDVEVQA